ncbi:ferredoxin reductase domain-containing protein [Mycolicibacterium stellerae]|uniref:hypothetical protein n=1 Tax=Mycolicibacterium stellerae TaxID=2358193 RepID=UPI000F0BB0DE|nr:hypothetical protein [Mycolicibacterium stellerae]
MRLEFHFKRAVGGLATDGWIFQRMQVGDRVALRGLLGQFGLVNKQDEPALLTSGGTGLALLKSTRAARIGRTPRPDLYLYHGGRRRDDLYDVEYFAAPEFISKEEFTVSGAPSATTATVSE